MVFQKRKTHGTGMSQSHIGKANMDGIEAAVNEAPSVPFVEPPVPSPGGFAFWVSPGDPAMDPAAGALLVIYTDEMGTVYRRALAQPMIGPGQIIP